MPKLKIGTIMPTPEEEVLINAGIAADPDTYELSDDEFKLLKPMRGRPLGSAAAQTKVAISVRLDADVLAYFKSEGQGWQTRINDALKSLIAHRR